jgi:FlaA1/EpsC-like NDP-sugar epimerase
MSTRLMDLPPALRVWVRLLLYAAELAASLWLAYDLRFDFLVGPASAQERLVVLSWLVPLQLVLLALFLQFSPLLGYLSTPDLARMCYALGISAALAMGMWSALGAGYASPRGVIMIDLVFSLVGLTGARLALRTLRERLASSSKPGNSIRPHVAVIGAGDAGALLAHQLFLKPGYGLNPVAFFDDDSRKWSSRVHGIQVRGRRSKPCAKLVG